VECYGIIGGTIEPVAKGKRSGEQLRRETEMAIAGTRRGRGETADKGEAGGQMRGSWRQ